MRMQKPGLRPLTALCALGLLFSGLCFTDPAFAKSDKAKDGDKPAHASAQQSDSDNGTGNEVLDAVVDATSRALMEDYFKEHPQPPKALPPGIAKNLKRGKPLPPGIAKRNLPTDLSDRLKKNGSTIGDVLDAVIVGDDVAVVDAASGVIVEILKDLARGQQ